MGGRAEGGKMSTCAGGWLGRAEGGTSKREGGVRGCGIVGALVLGEESWW